MHLDYLTGACSCMHSSTAIGLVTCSTHKFRPSLEGCGNQGRTNIAWGANQPLPSHTHVYLSLSLIYSMLTCTCSKHHQVITRSQQIRCSRTVSFVWVYCSKLVHITGGARILCFGCCHAEGELASSAAALSGIAFIKLYNNDYNHYTPTGNTCNVQINHV